MNAGLTGNARIFAIIVAYSDISALQRCIGGLFGQTIPIHKVILIDNNPSSAVATLIGGFPGAWQNKIQYLRSPRNLGSAGGFSQGMALAAQDGAQWLWLHDEDDYPDRDCLEQLLRHNTGMIRAPQIVDPETGKILRYFKRVQGPLGYFHVASLDRLQVDVAGTAGLLLHREVITRIGVYDPDFFIGYEDYEYCLRSRRAGLSVDLVNEAVIFHPDHQSSTFSRHPLLDRILAYLPSFWGAIHKGSTRDIYGTRNYIIVSKRYKPFPIILLELLLSLSVLPLLKVLNPRIDLRLTVKTYLKALCVG